LFGWSQGPALELLRSVGPALELLKVVMSLASVAIIKHKHVKTC